MKSLAENVRTARLFNGWTQEQLAQRAGVSQTTIDKIEQGKTQKTRFLAHIALALDVPPEILDPTLAKAKEDWKKAQQERPGNFYVMKTLEELPMYAVQATGDVGLFRLSRDPIGKVPAPRWMDGIRNICVCWDSDDMSPELEAGDALFFDLGGALYPGKTGIFMSGTRDEALCLVARLVMADEDYWSVKLIKHDVALKISMKEWPVCGPLRVRYCKDPGDKFD